MDVPPWTPGVPKEVPLSIKKFHKGCCTIIKLKLKKIRKIVRHFWRFFFSLNSFSKFLQFWLNLSARTDLFVKEIAIFWHPWDPCGRVDSDRNSVQIGCVPLHILVFVGVKEFFKSPFLCVFVYPQTFIPSDGSAIATL